MYVYAGEYNESITIQEQIYLIGESNETTFINGVDTALQTVLTESATNVVISGFTITLPSQQFESTFGIEITSSYTTVSNNKMLADSDNYLNSFCIIIYDNTHWNIISNNTIIDTSESHIGIGFGGFLSSNNKIIDNTISGCAYAVLGAGEYNSFLRNTVTDSFEGISDSGYYSLIKDNKILHCSF